MSDIVHGFADDAMGCLDAVAIAERIRVGEVSAEEVTEAAIARAEHVNPRLNGFAHTAFQSARDQSARCGAGPFAGVPVVIKDNVDVSGMPTCYGSRAFDPHPAKRTAAPAGQVVEQGYIVLGKSTMPEWGLTASTEYADRPPTRNPWNTGRSAGASSGGSAALVASGVVPVAHANDGGGSIRIPAAVNGLVGLKPTRDRLLNQPGANQLPINIAAEGVVTRTVRDTAHHLAALERPRPSRHLPPIGLVEGPGTTRLRIGVITETPAGEVDPEMIVTVHAAAALLAGLGHEITVDVAMPVDRRFVTDFARYWGFFAVALTASSKLTKPGAFHPTRLDPFTRALFRDSLSQVQHWPGAIVRLRRDAAQAEKISERFDVVLSPVLCHPAPELGYLNPGLPFREFFDRTIAYGGFTALNNVGGTPAISLPFGMLDNGLPGSIHLAAATGNERTLLELAYEIEAAQPFPQIGNPAATKEELQ